jgi:hypothetical protein
VVVPPDSGYSQNNEFGYLCLRCHISDSTGTNTRQLIHHGGPGGPAPPYPGPLNRCKDCHGSFPGPPRPINCGKCHYHGSTDNWLHDKRSDMETGWRTF